MDVGLDGDGVIDQKLEPDFVNIVDIPIEEEPNYVKSGTIETDYKKPFSKVWLWISIPTIIILLIPFLLKRKRY